MKDVQRQQFRWAPHVTGAASVKRRDYDEAERVEARDEYHAWRLMRDSERPLQVGDLLELEDATLRICKYVGFERAEWVAGQPVAPGQPEANPSASNGA